jgi:hypothetical protein
VEQGARNIMATVYFNSMRTGDENDKDSQGAQEDKSIELCVRGELS